jgi:GNAT superfamily N-acetyltransferase
MSIARPSDAMAFHAAAAPVFARDEALASSYVAFATGLLRNPPTEAETVYLATFAEGDLIGAAVMHRLGGLWISASDADAACIAPVYAPPHARGRGYASALVAELSQSLLDQGRQRLFLITNLGNPVSNSIDAKIGYRPQSDLVHFDFVDPLPDAEGRL